MNRYFRLTWITIKFSFKRDASFRVSFIMHRISQIVAYAVDFGLTWIMVNAFGSMNGWTKYEVILLYAMSLASYALAGFFFFNINAITKEIRNGQFDDILVKPMNVLPYLICTRFNSGYVGHLALSIGLILFCFSHLGTVLTFAKLAFFLFTLLTGALIYGGMLLMAAAPAFFFVESEALNRLIFFFRQMSYYPLSIFPHILQIALTIIIPYGLINYFPVQAVLGKADFLFFGSFIQYAAPIGAVLFFAMAVLFFTSGVRHYKSTGS